jgi:hypothetical protein
MAQVVEHLPSKYEALSSNSTPAKTKQNRDYVFKGRPQAEGKEALPGQGHNRTPTQDRDLA